jgi:hypothetical protein
MENGVSPQTPLTFSRLIEKKSAKRDQDSACFAQKTTDKRLKTPQTRFFVPQKLKQGCFLTVFSPCFFGSTAEVVHILKDTISKIELMLL